MSDNFVTPIIDPDRGYREWLISEIFDGTAEGGRYVPNVNDSVWSWDQGRFRVVDVDYTTGFSTLQKYAPAKTPDAIDDTDVLLGVTPGHQPESHRLYVDKSVLPHPMAVDSRLRIYDTDARSIKIFKGNDITDNGKVISRRYDQNGDYLSENIPLKNVVTPVPLDVELGSDAQWVENVMVPEVGYTIDDVADGDPVVAVAYGAEGNAISINRLLVKNTSFVRSVDANKRYVTGIYLESPFISGSDPRVLEYPINMPAQSLAMVGIVAFSDGGVERLPIDGTKFALHGLDTFIPTILGERIPIALTYYLSGNETAYGAEGGEVKHVTETYFAKTVEVDGAYSVKLFAYPTWIDQSNGYRMEYYLYNLDRERVYDATPYVRLTASSPTYNPTLYGQVQNLALAVNLSEVNGEFANYTHTQTIGVTLREEGSVDANNWEIQYSPNNPPTFGGAGMAAYFEFVNAEFFRLDISLGAGSKADWLGKIFDPTLPLYNPRTENRPPEPTHFNLYFNNRRVEYTIDRWNEELEVPNDLKEGETLLVEFFKRTTQTDLQLAIAGLPMHQRFAD